MEKENLPKWEDITRLELGRLVAQTTKGEIANMFNITVNDVNKKMKNMELNSFGCALEFKDLTTDLDDIKETILFSKSGMEQRAHRISQYLIKDIITPDFKDKFSKKELDKMYYNMVSKVCGLLDIATDKDWVRLGIILNNLPNPQGYTYTSIDREYVDKLYENHLKKIEVLGYGSN